MSEPIAQRTLVKSPPELWAEISDVEALARHLGAFGDIRITRMVPETSVSWEGDSVRGTVQLSAAGWGTKVTLTATATAEPAGNAPAAAEPPAPTPAPSPGPRADAPGTPAPVDRTPPPAPPEEARWAASVEQKVRDRYVGAIPVTSAVHVRERMRDEPVPAPAESRAIETYPTAAASAPATTPDPAPAPAPAPTRSAAEVPQSSAPHSGVVKADEAPAPRGLLARMKAWFAPPAAWEADAAQATPSPVEPQASAPIELQASAPVEPATSTAEDATPNVVPFPSAPPTPQPLPEPLPAAATHVATPPLAAPATDATPEPADSTVRATASPPSPARVDDGTIVGILTGVLDELGSAHHRPFSRG